MARQNLAAFDIGNSVQGLLNNIFTFLPKLAAAIVIFIVGYLIAKALEKILDKVLQRAGFDRLVERGGVKTALARSQYDASSLLGRLVFYAIMLFTLSTAFGVFGNNPVSDYLRAVIAYLPKIFAAVLIIVVAAAIAGGVKAFINAALAGLSYGRLVGTIASAFITFLGIIAALQQINIATYVTQTVLVAVLAALAGIVVVGVGGGLIKPMQERWEQSLTTLSQERSNISRGMAAQRDKLAAQAEDKLQESQQAYPSDPNAQTQRTQVPGAVRQ